MEDEVHDLLDSALGKEIAAEAVYIAAHDKTPDPGAKELMKKLASDERKHARWIVDLRDTDVAKQWHRGVVADLKITDHLTGPDQLDGAGLQDTLVFAIKREQSSVEFYSRMMGMMQTESAKRLCEKLAHQELRHKLKLETLYDSLFLGED